MRLRRRQKFSLVQLSLVKLFSITSSFGRKLFTLFQLMGSTCEKRGFHPRKGLCSRIGWLSGAFKATVSERSGRLFITKILVIPIHSDYTSSVKAENSRRIKCV